jgi:hypothetical protein
MRCSKLRWFLLAALWSLGCSEPNTAADADDPCGPEDDVEHAAQTAGQAAKTGGTTAWEGIKTAGKSVGGLFDGGSSEAKREWNEGKERTAETANEGATATRETAHSHPCQE